MISNRIPRYGTALLEALQFSNPNHDALRILSATEWDQLLALCDQTQLTLMLGHLCGPSLPDCIRDRIERNSLDNAARFARLKSAAFEIAEALSARSIEFVFLKGFVHSPLFSPDPLLRVQGDIDIWCLPESILAANDVLTALGYRPIGHSKGRHLPPMVRETNWKWRGDYFAQDLPIPVDLHYQLWDETMEGIPGPREREVWSRQSQTAFGAGRCAPVLDLADTLAFAALHLLMHLLHGDLRLQRAWEIAYFLNGRPEDDQFWLRWHGLYSSQVRGLQVVVFCLVHRWFNCGLPSLITEGARALPEDTKFWMHKYGVSPVESLFVPNKDELWLNMCLLSSSRARIRVFCRRLFPINAVELAATTQASARPGNAPHNAGEFRYLIRRAGHHSRTLLPACGRGVQWWWLRKRLGRDFLVFLLGSALFDFGEFIFFLLYNLYLLDSGYRESFIGQLAAAVTAGTLVGVLPAAAIAGRIGLRRALLLAIAGTACATTLRAVVLSQPALLGAAFLNGVFMSFWAVTLPPTVAGFTDSRNRAFGFALITSVGIGIGALAGFLGGQLPGLLLRLGLFSTGVQSNRAALIAGSALAALAFLPTFSVRFPEAVTIHREKNIYPRSAFVYLFLLSVFVWTAGTNGFNPFFNVYFANRLGLGAPAIGAIFSSGQLMQVLVILLVPAIVKRLGEVRSVAYMQVATAASLALLAIVHGARMGAVLYVGYVCFQYMSEPCLLSMLMSRTEAPHRNGASALNFFVVSLAGMFASAAAGAMLSNIGYKLTLTTFAFVTILAAMVFYFSFDRRAPVHTVLHAQSGAQT